MKKGTASLILARAASRGLRATVDLLSKRKGRYRRQYVRAQRLFERAQKESNPLYNPFHDVENNIRKAYLDHCWKSAAPYGNKETKRVYDWNKGTVGPLNALFNFAGARLRDMAMTRYPFPLPEHYQVWRYKDKRVKVVPKRIVDGLKARNEFNSFKRREGFAASWKAGYPGTSNAPRYFLAHSTLPSLDFVDMIRTPVLEVCRLCFIYSVPRSVAQRYINLIIHRLRPFLDYVYTKREVGEPHYNKLVWSIVGEIRREIRGLYGRNVGFRRRASKEHRESRMDTTVDLLRCLVNTHLEESAKEEEKTVCHDLLSKIDTGLLQDRDVEKLVERVLELTSEDGTRWHRILLSGLHHPQSLKQVIFAGDGMLDTKSSVLAVAELPVNRGQGQVDLTLFLRRDVQGQVLWTPVMILEVKTKGAFDINVFGLEKGDRCLPATYVWRRPQTDAEWKSLTRSTLQRDTLVQLQSYEGALLSEYRGLTPTDTAAPAHLWKGVVILDPTEDTETTYTAFHTILEELMASLSLGPEDMVRGPAFHTLPEARGRAPRVGLNLLDAPGPDHLLGEPVPASEIHVEDPFLDRSRDDRFLTLLISVAAPTSSGNTAAWFAQHWYLFHHLQECRAERDIPVYWLDLLGDFRSEKLQERRFGLKTLVRQRRISMGQYRTLTQLLEDITFVDLSGDTDNLLSGAKNAVDALIRTAREKLRPSEDTEKIIILSGWSDLESMALPRQRTLLRSLELQLLDRLPVRNTDLLWLDSGEEHTLMSAEHQRQCITPLRFDSPSRTHLDQIIYNLPTTSVSFGSLTPRVDSLRVIVEDNPVSPWKTTIHIPALVGLTRRFAALHSRSRRLTQAQVEQMQVTNQAMHHRGLSLSGVQATLPGLSGVEQEELMEDALELVPSLRRPREDITVMEEGHEGTERMPLQVTHVDRGSVTLTERLVYAPGRPPPRPPRLSEAYVPLQQVTDRWQYERNPVYLKEYQEETPPAPVCRPPLPSVGTLHSPDTGRSRTWEVRRLRSTVQGLLKTSLSRDLRRICIEIRALCTACLIERTISSLEVLRQVRDLLCSDPGTALVWEHLRPLREGLPDLLNTKNRERLQDHRDLLTLYGNNLFLMVLAAAHATGVTHYETLWSAVAEWTLYQLGLRPEADGVKSHYLMRTVYRDLLSRGRFLKHSSIPAPALERPRTGQAVWTEYDGASALALVIPHQKRMVSALLTGLDTAGLYPRFYQGETDPEVRREVARSALRSQHRVPLSVSRVGDHTVLWVHGEDGAVPMVLTYGHPDSRSGVVSWVRLAWPYEHEDLLQEVLVPPPAPREDEDAVNVHLLHLAQVGAEPISVTLTLSVDALQRLYVVTVRGDSFEETLTFSKTSRLLRFLRHPMRKGVPYALGGVLVRWDHLTDIDYGDLTFLLPPVHRSRFYPEEYRYPESCAEYLAAGRGEEVTMSPRRDGTSLMLSLEGLPEESGLRALKSVAFSIRDLTILAEATELYDAERRSLHSVVLDAREMVDIPLEYAEEYGVLRSAVEDAVQALRDQDLEPDESWEGMGEPEYLEDDSDTSESTMQDFLLEGVVYTRGHVAVVRDRLVVTLESEEGDEGELVVVEGVKSFVEVERDTGGRSVDRLLAEVGARLEDHGLDDDVLEEVLRGVRKELKALGVRGLDRGQGSLGGQC